MPPITSPFAQIMGSLPPLIPKPEPLMVPPTDGSMPFDRPLPDLPSYLAPKVSLARFDPATASPQELAMQPLTSRLRKDEAKDLNPWGTDQNHPGFLGKLGHALSVATGGPNRRAYEEMGLQKSLQDLLGSQSRNQLEGAQTEETKAHALALENPPEKDERPYTISTDEGVLQWDPEKSNWMPVEVNGDTAMPYAKPTMAAHFQHVAGVNAKGKKISANYDPNKGEFTDLQGNVLKDFNPIDKEMEGVLGKYAPVRLLQGLLNTAYNDNPALLPIVGKLASQIMAQYGVSPSQAESQIGAVPAGQPQSSEGGAIGIRMPEAPTGSTRSRGQFAGEVLPTMHKAEQEVDNLGDSLGPFMGRISDLVTGKIGVYGPKFSALQTELHNIATGWGRLHGNSVETMKQFYDDLNASKDPANLKAKLQEYERQANIYKAGGAGRPENTNAPESSTPGKHLEMNGKEVIPKGGKWIYKDTGKEVE